MNLELVTMTKVYESTGDHFNKRETSVNTGSSSSLELHTHCKQETVTHTTRRVSDCFKEDILRSPFEECDDNTLVNNVQDLSMTALLSSAFLPRRNSQEQDVSREIDTKENEFSSSGLSGAAQSERDLSEFKSTASHGEDSNQMSSPSVAQFCVVCGEVANGNFFGAVVCLPCKSFFIRCTKDGEPTIFQQCNGSCDIQRQLRNRCQFCRYRQCLAVGMTRKEKPESIQPQEGQELCKVCGDLANGIHFGVFTCEGCKKFFRRGMKEHLSYSCKGQSGCVLNPRNRNNCRFCRYKKCVLVGMSREAIKMGRPRKLYPNRSIHELLQTTDSPVTHDSLTDIKDTCHVIREDGSSGLTPDVATHLEHPPYCRRESNSRNIWSVEGGARDLDHIRSFQDSLISQQHEKYIHNHILLETVPNPGLSSKNRLESLNARPSLSQGVSQAGKKHCLPTESFSKTNFSFLPKFQTPGQVYVGSFDPHKFSEVRPGAFRNTGEPQHQQMLLKQEPSSEEIAVDDSGVLNLKTEVTDIQQIHSKSNDSLWMSNLSQVQLLDLAAVRSNKNMLSLQANTGETSNQSILSLQSNTGKNSSTNILSRQVNTNEDYQLTSSEISQTKLSASNNDLGLPLRALKLKGTENSDKLSPDLERQMSSHQRITSDFPVFLRKTEKLIPYQSTLKRPPEAISGSHSPQHKSARYDSLILDLSISTNTNSPSARNNFKTNNIISSNNINGNQFLDITNWSSSDISAKHGIDFHETANQNTSKTSAAVQTYSRKLNFWNSSSEHPISAGGNSYLQVPNSLSSRTEKTVNVRCPKLNTSYSYNHRHRIGNIFSETTKNEPQESESLTCSKSRISETYEQQKPEPLASIWESGSRILPRAKSEPENPKLPMSCNYSSFSRVSSEPLTHPKHSIPSSSTGDNGPSLKTSASAFSLSSSYHVSTIFNQFLVNNSQEEERKSTSRSTRSLHPSDSLTLTSEAEIRNVLVADEASWKSCQGNFQQKSFSPYTNERTILYINELFMLVETLTVAITASRSSKDRISAEMEALDEMLSNAYGYSPVKVSQFWKNLQATIPSASPEKWLAVLTPAHLGWLQDITSIYSAQVEACDEDINPPTVNMNTCEMWPPPGEDTNHWRHFQERVAKQTLAVAQFFLKLPEMDKIHPKDRIQLSNNTRLYGNTILMASQEWFDPVRKRFKFFWNWKYPAQNPLHPFRNHMIRLGSHIFNMHMDKKEVAILSALNIISPETSTFHNLAQLTGHTQTLIKILSYYLYTINVDPEERIPELLSVMPKVRHMTMWYSNLIKNMRVDPSSMDRTLQDLTLLAGKL